MSSFNLNDCKYNFTSDNVNIIVLVYDESGSMEYDKLSIRKANTAFLKDFSKFEDKGSIVVSKVSFADYFEMTPFLSVDEFDTGYTAQGGTELYYSIAASVENTILYYNELVKRLNIRPRITFLVFTDGGDTSDSTKRYKQAKEAIEKLNALDATTVFVAFRDAIRNEDGTKLKFTCTREISKVNDLITCLGKQLSKSCIEQSKSVYALKSEFFSKAEKNSDEDNVEENPITDDDFFNI